MNLLVSIPHFGLLAFYVSAFDPCTETIHISGNFGLARLLAAPSQVFSCIREFIRYASTFWFLAETSQVSALYKICMASLVKCGFKKVVSGGICLWQERPLYSIEDAAGLKLLWQHA